MASDPRSRINNAQPLGRRASVPSRRPRVTVTAAAAAEALYDSYIINQLAAGAELLSWTEGGDVVMVAVPRARVPRKVASGVGFATAPRGAA